MSRDLKSIIIHLILAHSASFNRIYSGYRTVITIQIASSALNHWQREIVFDSFATVSNNYGS
jgi:hypothetical protein